VFRIATFNVKDLFSPSKSEHEQIFERKLDTLAEEIDASQASVLALQEIGDAPAFERLLMRPELSGFTPIVGTPDERGIRCAILTKVAVGPTGKAGGGTLVSSKVHTTDTLPFPVFVEGDSVPFANRLPLRRGVVHVELDVPLLGRVAVLTHHMKSNLPRALKQTSGTDKAVDSGFARGESVVRSAIMRSAEALYLRQLVDALDTPLVCVLGDFNDDRKSAALRILSGDRDAPRPLWQMVDRVPEHKRFSTLHKGKPSLIDHILVTPELAAYVWDADIQNESLRDHGPFVPDAAPVYDSDHALFWIQLDVRQSMPAPASSKV
jgi:endonuclease/exonuclease/phosphatase family metal-dependent hydrolase